MQRRSLLLEAHQRLALLLLARELAGLLHLEGGEEGPPQQRGKGFQHAVKACSNQSMQLACWPAACCSAFS